MKGKFYYLLNDLDQGPEVKNKLARSVRENRDLNILQYEKKTRLINSLLKGQEMRESQPSLKGFCDLGLKLECCWVTHWQDAVDRFLHLQAISQLIKLMFY